MKIEMKIDYMQFTSDKPYGNESDPYEIKKSYEKNYKMMRVYENGLVCHTGHNKSKRWKNVLSGKVCDLIDNQASKIKELLVDGATFSRIDLAITVEDGISVSLFQQWARKKIVFGALADRGIMTIENDKEQRVETTYVGDLSRRGDFGVFRCYDKAVQIGIDGRNLVRLELEERKDRAQITAKRFANGMNIGDLIRQRVDVDADLWREICGSKSEQLSRYKDEKNMEIIDTTWIWLCEVVAISLGKKLAEDEVSGKGFGNRERFENAMNKAYEKHKRLITDLNYVPLDDSDI